MGLLLDAGSPLVVVFGGSGFIGRYVVHRMVKLGFRVKVAVRYPNEALFLKTYGEVGQVEILKISILNEEAIRSVISSADYVVNCVAGLLNETDHKKSELIYVKGSGLIAKFARLEGVKRLVHISALGVSLESPSFYSRHKAQGEIAVLENFSSSVILRPSVVFGFEDKFFNRFASIALISPVIPIIGGSTKLQPVFVDDLAFAVQVAITNSNISGLFEITGPEVFSFKQLIEKMLKVIRRRRLIFSVPFFYARLMASSFKILKLLTFGLFSPPITRDNIENLMQDNIITFNEDKTIKALGIKPKNLDIILPKYLYSYRPYGQYSDIKESGK